MRTEDERGFDAAMRGALRDGAAAGGSTCVDAETLAAWSEGTLAPAQARIVEAHLASCARCVAMLAAFARADAESVPTSELPVPFWRRWRLQWLVPIAATAMAIAVWVAVPGQPPMSQASRTMPLPPEIPRPAEERLQAPGTMADATGADAAPSQSADGRRERSALRQETGALLKDSVAAAKPSAPAVEQRLDATADKQAETSPSAAVTTPPAAVEQFGAVAPATNAPRAPAAAASNDQLQALTRAQLNDVASVLEITSPDPNIRWRTVLGGRVEFTTTAGREWTAATISGRDGIPSITAGSAPDPRTCWLVGGGGIVLLSTDGKSFNHVALPAPVDLTAVRADDARRATVTAADGRVFGTTDGGGTWTPR